MPPGLVSSQLSQIISQAIAPSFLLGAVAAFVSVLIGRVNRIFDSAEALLSIDDQNSERAKLKEEIPLLRRRAKLISRAIEFAVISGICTTFLVILAFASAMIGLSYAFGAAFLFVAALAAFATSLIHLWLEIRLAIKQLDRVL